MASKQYVHGQQQHSPGKTKNLLKIPFDQANISLHFSKSICERKSIICYTDYGSLVSCFSTTSAF